MDHLIFLKGVALLVHKVHADILVVGVHLAAAGVGHHEHRLDAGGGLGAEAHAAGGRNGKQCDVAPSEGDHFIVQLRVGLTDTADEGVHTLLVCIVDGEFATLLG